MAGTKVPFVPIFFFLLLQIIRCCLTRKRSIVFRSSVFFLAKHLPGVFKGGSHGVPPLQEMVDIPWLLSDCVLILFYYSTHGWELRFRIIAAFQMGKNGFSFGCFFSAFCSNRRRSSLT